jgi:hypothetical protein
MLLWRRLHIFCRRCRRRDRKTRTLIQVQDRHCDCRHYGHDNNDYWIAHRAILHASRQADGVRGRTDCKASNEASVDGDREHFVILGETEIVVAALALRVFGFKDTRSLGLLLERAPFAAPRTDNLLDLCGLFVADLIVGESSGSAHAHGERSQNGSSHGKPPQYKRQEHRLGRQWRVRPDRLLTRSNEIGGP